MQYTGDRTSKQGGDYRSQSVIANTLKQDKTWL